MVHQYFFDSDLNWEEIDKLTKAIPGEATWTFVGEMEFAKKGLDVRNIEPVDYERLFKEGVAYLSEVVGKQNAEYYFNKSNIDSVIQYIPEYLKYVNHETRKSSLAEIIELLQQGYLIGAEVNSSILNKRDGFDLHFVLIYDADKEHIILHDPGLPPIESRKVSFREFDACFAYPGANQGITTFKLK